MCVYPAKRNRLTPKPDSSSGVCMFQNFSDGKREILPTGRGILSIAVGHNKVLEKRSMGFAGRCMFVSSPISTLSQLPVDPCVLCFSTAHIVLREVGDELIVYDTVLSCVGSGKGMNKNISNKTLDSQALKYFPVPCQKLIQFWPLSSSSSSARMRASGLLHQMRTIIQLFTFC